MYIVIGAGIAGLSAGIRLIRNGIAPNEVLIVEKKQFPTDKIYSGLLTMNEMRLLRDLGLNKDKFETDQVHCVNVFYKHRVLNEINLCKPYYYVENDKLDSLLLSKYLQLGGTILEDMQVVEIDKNNQVIRLSNRDSYAYTKLIIATGTKEENCRNVSLECVIPKSMVYKEKRGNSVDIDVGTVKGGFMWKYPKGDSLVVGFITTFESGVNYKIKFIELVRELYGYTALLKNIIMNFVVGYPPLEEVMEKRSVFLVGDAGNFVDTRTNEGIYYALLSGILAAQCIADGNDYNEATYKTRMKLTKSYKANRIFYTFRDTHVAKIISKEMRKGSLFNKSLI